MKIGILAVQGAFIEHETMLSSLGVESFEIRKKQDLEQPFEGLILPGGESTVIGKLLRDLAILEPMRNRIKDGLPVLGTCAGLILLASELEGQESVHLGTLPVTVTRNAYGRQLGSFQVLSEMKKAGKIPMTFIRAPYISAVGDSVEILAVVENRIAAVRYRNQLGVAFHPELTQDTSVHSYFLDMIHNCYVSPPLL